MSTNFRTLTIFYLTLTKPLFSILYHCVASHKISPVFLGARKWTVGQKCTIWQFCSFVAMSRTWPISNSIVSGNFRLCCHVVLIWQRAVSLSKCLCSCSCLLKMISLKGRHTFIPFFCGLFSILLFMYIMAQMLDYFHSILTSSPDMQSKI